MREFAFLTDAEFEVLYAAMLAVKQPSQTPNDQKDNPSPEFTLKRKVALESMYRPGFLPENFGEI